MVPVLVTSLMGLLYFWLVVVLVEVVVVLLLANFILAELNCNFNAFASKDLFLLAESAGLAHKLSFLIMLSRIFSDCFLAISGGGRSEYCVTPLLSFQRYTSADKSFAEPASSSINVNETPSFVE